MANAASDPLNLSTRRMSRSDACLKPSRPRMSMIELPAGVSYPDVQTDTATGIGVIVSLTHRGGSRGVAVIVDKRGGRCNDGSMCEKCGDGVHNICLRDLSRNRYGSTKRRIGSVSKQKSTCDQDDTRCCHKHERCNNVECVFDDRVKKNARGHKSTCDHKNAMRPIACASNPRRNSTCTTRHIVTCDFSKGMAAAMMS